MDLADLTATAARARIEAGQLDPAELMEACLARIAEREPTVHAMAYLATLGWPGTPPPARARAHCMACRWA